MHPPSDPAMKQLLLKLHEEEPFIIEDLDDTHLFIQEKYMDTLQQKFDLALEENVYKVAEEVRSTW